VVALAQARGATAVAGQPGERPTEATVQGPFFWPGAPKKELGEDIGGGLGGTSVSYSATDHTGLDYVDLSYIGGDGTFRR